MSIKLTLFYKKTRRNLLICRPQVSGDESDPCGKKSKLFVSRHPRHFKTKKKLFQTNFTWNADAEYANSGFNFHLLGYK